MAGTATKSIPDCKFRLIFEQYQSSRNGLGKYGRSLEMVPHCFLSIVRTKSVKDV